MFVVSYSRLFVEMSVARLRALTQIIFYEQFSKIVPVEMSVARLRALTLDVRPQITIVIRVSRNECGPFEGIDTPSAAKRALRSAS